MRFSTQDVDNAEMILREVDGIEPIIVDDKLVALKIGTIRVAPESGILVISVEHI